MLFLKPELFFDLSYFEHRAIFSDCQHVWEVIPKISNYLKTISLGKLEVEIPQGAHLVNRDLISIGKGSIIEPGAYIKGPCIIGQDCVIRHGAYIRGDFIAGNKCVIGHDTEVKNSIFLDQVHAAHFAYVGDSVLGQNTNLGAGTKCANLKFDSGEISVLFEGSFVKTGLRKFGAILGDSCQTGCNSVLNPGTLFGKGVFCYPCVNIGGYIEANQIVKPLHKPIILPARGILNP